MRHAKTPYRVRRLLTNLSSRFVMLTSGCSGHEGQGVVLCHAPHVDLVSPPLTCKTVSGPEANKLRLLAANRGCMGQLQASSLRKP